MAQTGSARGSATTSIQADADVVTLINIFTVAPERQQDLVELLDRATEETMRNLPGFVSANIHRSLDGQHVANYAQWRSEADFRAMLANPEAQEHMRRSVEMARAEPVLYKVASVHR
jgi:heme-degrading monooxygenase HmoA